MAGRAGGLAKSRGAARVVKMPSAGGGADRRGVEKRYSIDHGVAGGIDDREARGKAIEHVKAMPRLVEGEATRAFAKLDGMGADTISVGVNRGDVSGTHAGDVTTASIGGP